MILRQFKSFLGSRCSPLALESPRGESEIQGKPWQRSPGRGSALPAESTGEKGGKGKVEVGVPQELLPRLTGKCPTGISPIPSPALPVLSERRLRECSAPTPKTPDNTQGVSPGNPHDPCPEHPAQIPARSPRLCLPSPPCFPMRGAALSPAPSHISQSQRCPTHLSPNFYHNPLLELPVAPLE